jgi:hypothetical protein
MQVRLGTSEIGSAQVKGLRAVHAVWHKSNKGQLARASKRFDSRSYMSGFSIDNQCSFAVLFGSFAEVSHFRDQHISESIDEQHFGDGSFVCSAHSVMALLKHLLDREGSFVGGLVL